MTKWISSLALLLLAACNDNVTPAAKTNDTPDTVQQAVVDDEMAVAQQAFPGLFAYLKKQDTTFSADSFLLSGENIVEREQTVPVDAEQLQPFQPYLIYNSDSSQAIDLYSHNYIVVPRNGKPSLEEGSPDAEAAVIDRKANTRRRVFFGGPSYVLWDAKWKSPTEFLLVGAETRDDKLIPTIWQIRLQDTTVEVYAYQGAVKADMSGYTKAKLNMGF